MKILIVENDSSERDVLRHLLESRFQERAKFREADDLETALNYLTRGDVDCIVLDLPFLDSDGKGLFAALHTQYPDIPILVMGHEADRIFALEMLVDGAADYVVKDVTDHEALFRRIVLAVELQKGHDARHGEFVTRRDPNTITARPHMLPTIHVPEVGPKLRADSSRPHRAERHEGSRAGAPSPVEATSSDETPPVEVDSTRIEDRVDAISGKMNVLLGLLCLLLLIALAALASSRRIGP